VFKTKEKSENEPWVCSLYNNHGRRLPDRGKRVFENWQLRRQAVTKKVLILLAEGFEEIETATPIDVLRRAGAEVIVAGVSSKTVTGSRGMQVCADVLLDEYHEIPDAVVLPGGAVGAQNLAGSRKVAEVIKKTHSEKKIVAAICASPALVLAPLGILNQRKATCYPGLEKKLSSSVTFVKDRVVVDGNVVTSRGPGSAFEFSFQLAELLFGKSKVEALRESMLVKG